MDPRDPTKILRLSFVMLDEESSTMDAEIQEEWVPIFANKICEGTVYFIQYFRVAQARSTYRAVDRPLMARFTKYTKITEVAPLPSDFPTYACTLVPFQTLRERDNDITLCSDIVGVFTGCAHLKDQGTKGGPKKLRNVYLSHGMETVSIALWGSHAEDFAADEYMELANKKPLVFLFVGLTSRTFKRSLICKWYVDPDIPEARSLCERFIALNRDIRQPIWHGSAVPAIDTEQVDVATLAAVTNPHTIYNKKYVVNVKIKCLKDNQQWWYHACALCNRHAILEDNVYRCSVRSCSSTKGGPRYRLPLIVTDPASSIQDDHAPSIELVIFGPKAEEVLGTPVHNLIAMQSGIGSFLPSKITDLYGRHFRMRISLSPSSLERRDISFQVSSIFPIPTSDPGLQKSDSSQSAVLPNTSSDNTAKSPEKVLHGQQGKDTTRESKLPDETQETILLEQQTVCTPPPIHTACSVEPKTYKRSRDDEDHITSSTDEGMPLSSICKEKGRAAKKLKFEAVTKEK